MKQIIIRAALVTSVLASTSALALAQAPAAQPPAATPPATQATADQAIEQIRKDARTDINAIIGASMQFTSDEASKFWPLYKVYEQNRKTLVDERLAIIKDYAQNYQAMNDAKAIELTQRGLALEEKAEAAKKGFLAELQKVLPGKTVARFYQVHRRIDMLVDLTLAQEVPLVK